MLQTAIKSYQKNGYGIIPNFLSPQTCSKMIDEIHRLIDSYNPTAEEIVVFSTKHDEYKKKEYYLGSKDQVRFFLEEGAYDDGEFRVEKRVGVSKIGHALHERNQMFKEISYRRLIKQICNSCGIVNPLVVQSMAILKPPKLNAKVVVHQDSTFLYDEPLSLMGFWVPFVDTTPQNGCLWGLPGSQNSPLYLRSSIPKSPSNPNPNNPPPKSPILLTLKQKDYNQQDFIPIPLKKGQLIFFNGVFLHKSQANRTQSPRYAYTWHIKERDNKWPEDNWLQRDRFGDGQFLY